MTSRIAPLLAALVAAVSGCAPRNDASIEVVDVCAPSDDATACAPTGGTCDRFITGNPWMFLQYDDGSGNLVNNGFFFYMQLNNQRPNNKDESAGRENTADARVTEYKLSYSTSGISLPGYTVSTTTVTVPAAGSTTPFVTLIPPELSATLQGLLPAGEATLVNVYVQFKGYYVDGSDWESKPFKVAVYVYNAVFPGYSCPKAGDVVTAVCPNFGQTASITCAAP
jgi:hypothetical protein